MKFTAYLNFDGRCTEAFEFYAGLFGGEITFMQTFGESPMSGHVGPDWQGAVMHATLKIGDDIINGSDAPPDRYHAPAGFSLSVSTSDMVRARHVFDALADGGQVTMPLQETFWSPGFGMLTDRFGIPWMINGETPA